MRKSDKKHGKGHFLKLPSTAKGPARMLPLFLIWRLHIVPQHGYSILKELRGIAVAPCKPSTVYSLLADLEESGLVKSKYVQNKGRTRRLYQTTAKGHKLFIDIKKSHVRGLWKEFARALAAD
jgi:DNA-binding PadR family transcriptional regulator